jgi:chromosome condensin MukBEF ATPase and DNA-binding subunit MukB
VTNVIHDDDVPLALQIEDLRLEMQRKEQDMLQMHAKMKTVEEQHTDYQRHIAVLKESLDAKEHHYNILQQDVRHFKHSTK